MQGRGKLLHWSDLLIALLIAVVQDPEVATDVPRVSPYRLAAHLGSAFLVYSILLWTTLSLAFPKPAAKSAVEAAAASRLRKWALPLSALLAITGMSGTLLHGATQD